MQSLNLKDFEANSYIGALRSDVIAYALNILSSKNKKCDLKGDYAEMLELCLLILGAELPNYKFHVPHACSHSRWMAKIIYCMKMYLFRHQLNFSRSEVKKMKDICIFICLVYVKKWIRCCNTSDATYNDLMLIKELERYAKTNKIISECAIEKLH